MCLSTLLVAGSIQASGAPGTPSKHDDISTYIGGSNSKARKARFKGENAGDYVFKIDGDGQDVIDWYEDPANFDVEAAYKAVEGRIPAGDPVEKDEVEAELKAQVTQLVNDKFQYADTTTFPIDGAKTWLINDCFFAAGRFDKAYQAYVTSLHPAPNPKPTIQDPVKEKKSYRNWILAGIVVAGASAWAINKFRQPRTAKAA